MIKKERRISLDMIIGDKNPEIGLRMEIQNDGDVVFWFYDYGDNFLKDLRVEFCTTGPGGGKSPNTLDASYNLLEAIRKDNKDISMQLSLFNFDELKNLKSLKPFHKRIGDMSPHDYIQILLQKDGDIVLTGFNFKPSYKKDEKPKLKSKMSLEFSASGGQSPHTKKALLNLCLAIQKDNNENPIGK